MDVSLDDKQSHGEETQVAEMWYYRKMLSYSFVHF